MHEDVRHEALQRLSAHYGIAAEYSDIFGKRHVAPPANLVSLLESFGVDPAVPAEESLRHAQAATWREQLPPAVAIGAGQAEWLLRVRLPAAQAEAAWTVHEEDGTPHHGRLALHSVSELLRTDIDGQAWCERLVPVALALPMGYHRLTVEELISETLVIAAPEQCYRPEALRGEGRVWGPAVQLYALRSRRN